jgi:hypothetical protein
MPRAARAAATRSPDRDSDDVSSYEWSDDHIVSKLEHHCALGDQLFLGRQGDSVEIFAGRVSPSKGFSGSCFPLSVLKWTHLHKTRDFLKKHPVIDIGAREMPVYTGDAPPSGTAEPSAAPGMRDDFDTEVKKAKAENLARAKPRSKPRSSMHQLANYRALVQNVDLLNPKLAPDERRRRANRLLTAYDRLREVRPRFRDRNAQLTEARRIKKAAHRERRRASENGSPLVALG